MVYFSLGCREGGPGDTMCVEVCIGKKGKALAPSGGRFIKWGDGWEKEK